MLLSNRFSPSFGLSGYPLADEWGTVLQSALAFRNRKNTRPGNRAAVMQWPVPVAIVCSQ